jgi:hypothetical protein
MIACDASITGAGGTRVSPAPSRADRRRWEPAWTRLVILEPLATARLEPKAVEPSRLEPRVMVDDTPATRPLSTGPRSRSAADPAAGAAAGLPQTSQ